MMPHSNKEKHPKLHYHLRGPTWSGLYVASWSHLVPWSLSIQQALQFVRHGDFCSPDGLSSRSLHGSSFPIFTVISQRFSWLPCPKASPVFAILPPTSLIFLSLNTQQVLCLLIYCLFFTLECKFQKSGLLSPLPPIFFTVSPVPRKMMDTWKSLNECMLSGWILK